MKVVSVIPGKGGVGTTMLATSLSSAAAHQGHSVLLLAEHNSGALWIAEQNQKSLPFKTKPIWFRDLALHLEWARFADFDLVIIDCPRDLSIAAICAPSSDLVVMPCRPAIFDMHSTRKALKLVQSFQNIVIVVLTHCDKFDPDTLDARQIFLKDGAELPFDDIYRRQAYSHAMEVGGTILETKPNSEEAEKIRSIWRYISNRLFGAADIRQKPQRKTKLKAVA